MDRKIAMAPPSKAGDGAAATGSASANNSKARLDFAPIDYSNRPVFNATG
jgi:hypothetical protein